MALKVGMVAKMNQKFHWWTIYVTMYCFSLVTWAFLLIGRRIWAATCPEQATYNMQPCHDMAPADWLFIYDMTQNRAEDKTRDAAYQAMRRIGERMIELLTSKSNPHSVDHKTAVLVADQNSSKVVASLCAKTATNSGLVWPEVGELVGEEKGVPVHVFSGIKRHLEACARKNVQQIVAVFAMSPVWTHYEKKEARKVAGETRKVAGETMDYLQNQTVSVQFYLIYADKFSGMEDFYTKISVDVSPRFLFDPPNYVGFKLAPPINESHLASHYLTCMCSKSEDCRYTVNNESKCHFVQLADELCIKIQKYRINFEPKRRLHPAAAKECDYFKETLQPCSNVTDCQIDCDLKKWGDWGPCVRSTSGVEYSIRKRLPNNASLGQFTRSCPGEEKLICTLTETAKTRITPEKMTKAKTRITAKKMMTKPKKTKGPKTPKSSPTTTVAAATSEAKTTTTTSSTTQAPVIIYAETPITSTGAISPLAGVLITVGVILLLLMGGLTLLLYRNSRKSRQRIKRLLILDDRSGKLFDGAENDRRPPPRDGPLPRRASSFRQSSWGKNKTPKTTKLKSKSKMPKIQSTDTGHYVNLKYKSGEGPEMPICRLHKKKLKKQY